MYDTSKTHHSSVTTPLPTYGVDIDQSSHGSVTKPPIQIVPLYRHRRLYGYPHGMRLYDRVLSIVIGSHTRGGMSLIRFVVISFFLSLALPFIVIIMAVLGIMYGVVYLPYKCFIEWMRYRTLKRQDNMKAQEHAYTMAQYGGEERFTEYVNNIVGYDKDMVTKNMECPKCGRLDCPSLMEGSGLTCAIIMEADKDMVTKDKSQAIPPNCQYCDSHEHVTSECPHRRMT